MKQVRHPEIDAPADGVLKVGVVVQNGAAQNVGAQNGVAGDAAAEVAVRSRPTTTTFS